MLKYEFTGETKQLKSCGRVITLKRIRAVAGFGPVEAGKLGGWIEKAGNLSQEGTAWVYGDARVYGNAEVYGNARVYGNAEVCGNAEVYGDARVCGNARVCGDASLFAADHILVIGPIGSRKAFTTFCRNKKQEIIVKCGCFLGTLDSFLERVTTTHGTSKYAKVYQAAAEMAKLQIDFSDSEN